MAVLHESNCWLDSGYRDRFFFAVFNLIFVFIRDSAVTSLTQINNLSAGLLLGLALPQLTTDKSHKDCVSHFVTDS